jgi:probable phosphoglycerate mutase
MQRDRPIPVSSAAPFVTTLVLIRHGETAWNREKRLQGQIDIALSDVGVQQARALAERFDAKSKVDATVNAQAAFSIDAVVSSDLSRAMQTAAPLAEVLGLTVVPEPGLRERHYGIFQATTRDQIAVQWPDDHARWIGHDPDFAPEGGESMRQLSERVVRTLASIGRMYAGKTVVCVTHGGVLDCAYRFAAPLPLEAPRQHALLNASVNTIQWYPGEIEHAAHGMAHLIAWGDVAHLASTKDDSI